MELRNRATGAVITADQFRSEHPNTSFPAVLTPEIIDDFGYDPILEGTQAAVTPPYEISQRAGIEEVNGQWFTKYVVGPIFVDNEEQTAAQQKAAYRQRIDDEAAKRVRNDRNKRLADCDWTQLPDAPFNVEAKSAWAFYRENLRMVPDQANFPWDVVWPPQPNT